MTPVGPQSVLIVGGGPAGLAAAYRLAGTGLRVTVTALSPSPERASIHAGLPPFTILGCHHATHDFLRSLGAESDSPALIECSLEFLLPNGRLARYPKSRFPNPLHQMLTIGRFAGLPWSTRWKLLSWLEQIWEGSLQLATDLEHRTALDWVESLGHDRSIVQTVWNPLACWLTGNDLRSLSADAFVVSLKPFFLSRSSDSRVYLPRRPWNEYVLQPLTDALARTGATLLRNARAMRLDYKDDRITGVRLADGSLLQADWYISALPHNQLTPLLPERWLTRYAYFQQITELTTVSWITTEALISPHTTIPRHILIGTGSFPLVTCRPSDSGQGTVASLCTPGDQPADDFAQRVARTLRSLGLLESTDRFSLTVPPTQVQPVLALPPGTKAKRPIQQSPIPNLFVAGAWTDTGWPANLESAIVSGQRCAELIVGRSPA